MPKRDSLNWPRLVELAEINQAALDAGTSSMKDIVEGHDIVLAIWRLANGWERILVKGRRRLNAASPPPQGAELQRIGSFTVVFVRSAEEGIALREDLGEAVRH